MSKPTPADRAVFERFSRKYDLGQSEVMREIERSVCGCDYGATSWTTLDEARVIAGKLGLGPGKHLLDVGSGSGWPGLYLAGEMGCDITLSDLPVTGLRIALERAKLDSLPGACWGCAADATALPFRDGLFDAIIHSDVLCCLAEKLEALKSCRRAVSDHGKMVFSVILIAPEVPASKYELAQAGGPPFIASDTPYPQLLRQAGWRITDQLDLTAEFQTSVTRMLGQLESHADEIGRIFGEADAADERSLRKAMLVALDQRLVRRELFVAVPSP